MRPLTEPQRLMLAALSEACDHEAYGDRKASPRQLAQMRWPDSEAWKRRTNMRGGRNGAIGGTMPMKAATVLYRLQERGCAVRTGSTYDSYANLWTITNLGLRVLAGAAQPREPR